MLTRPAISLTAVMAAAVLSLSAVARADTYTALPGDTKSLQAALNSAADHPGADTVAIPAGTYNGVFSYFGADPVDIAGAGRSSTTLAWNLAGSSTLDVENAASTVHGLTIVSTGGTSAKALQLPLGGSADDVRLEVSGNGSDALRADGDASLTHSAISVGANAGGVVEESGHMNVSDTTFEGNGGIGIKADGPTASMDVAHVRISNLLDPVAAEFGSSVRLRDSLLLLPANGGATALLADDNNNSSHDYTSTLTADRVTIVGVPGVSGYGAKARPNSAGDDFEVLIRNSVMTGVVEPLYCGGSTGVGVVWADYSNLPATGDENVCTGGGAVRTHPVGGTPTFVDAAAGDFRLPFDSPLVDAGGPALLAPDTDLAGLARPVGPSDLGAYEYQRQAPVVTASSTPDAGTPGDPLGFSASASDPDPGETPTGYSWQFDDGTSAAGASVTHAFATAGRHSAVVTVTDPAGMTASATATVTVTSTATGPTGSAGDHARPTVSGFRFSPKRAATGGRRSRFSFTVSEAATVKIRFERRAGKRWTKVLGALTSKVPAGRSAIRFAGRLSRKAALSPGSYRATLVARDAAGNASAPVRARLTLVKAA